MNGQHAETVGEYYENQARKARRLSAELEQAIKTKAPSAEIQRLARLLEAAYYVGD